MAFNPTIVKNNDAPVKDTGVLNDKVDMKPMVYKKMQGPTAKVEFAKKGDMCVIQLFPNKPRVYIKKDALMIIMLLEKLIPPNLKCKIMPPSKVADFYTIEIKNFYLIPNIDRQVEKIAYNLSKMKFTS